MKNKNKVFKIISSTMVFLSFVFVASPVFAQTTATTTPTATSTTKGAANLAKMIARSDTEITQRINSLNNLTTRINAMQKVSPAEQGTLASSLQDEVTAMTNLKTMIDADTTASTLKADMQSITQSYRIYMLILPQASIAAASDRVLTIVDLMNGVNTKLQTLPYNQLCQILLLSYLMPRHRQMQH